ncbi:hypothetical protein PLICRDRAFT_230817 [Plicaturopsis crispa FD-325 SS-3]|nr:hypothetical protein PLICRDRAFT_230817 [Plicaturopsis crispa FD-325 SS-3]
MASISSSFINLDVDVVTMVLEALIQTTIPPHGQPYRTPRNPARALLPLSLTCKGLRDQTLPWIFRDVYCWPRGPWPQSLRRYIRIAHLRDQVMRDDDEEGTRIDITQYVGLLPTFTALRTLVLNFSGRPMNTLLQSALGAPSLEALCIEGARLDGCRLPAFSHFTMLRRLVLSVNFPPRGEIDNEEECQNVAFYLRHLSASLHELETAGDLCKFSALSTLRWPCLKSLTMTDHPPLEPMSLPAVIVNMPVLHTLHMNFSVHCDGPWRQTPPFVYIPIAAATPHSLPNLRSLALSNVSGLPHDCILENLPRSLTSLRVSAFRDDPGLTSGVMAYWPSLRPLSPLDALRLVRCAAQMPELVSLAVSLSLPPSLELVQEVVSACPQLRFLELQDSNYGVRNSYPVPLVPLEIMSDTLSRLVHLREVRISVVDVKAFIPASRRFMEPYVQFAESLAKSLARLKLVSVSSVWDRYELDPWLRFTVHRIAIPGRSGTMGTVKHLWV